MGGAKPRSAALGQSLRSASRDRRDGHRHWEHGMRSTWPDMRPVLVPQIWKPGQARLIKAGAALIFTNALHRGQQAKRRTARASAWCSPKKPVAERIVAMEAMDPGLAIPPGDPSYRVEATAVVSQPVSLVGMPRPYAYLRGKSFQFRAVYPTGETEDPAGHTQVRFWLAAAITIWKRPSSCHVAFADRMHRRVRQFRQQSSQSRSGRYCDVGAANLG